MVQAMESDSSLKEILLDIEIFLDTLPQINKSKEIAKRFEEMHLFAEEIFEKSLTSKMKELFD